MDFAILGIGLFLTYLNVFPFNKELNRDQIFPEEITIQELPDKSYRVRKKNLQELNNQKRIQRSPFIYGIQTYSIYSSEEVNYTLLKEVSITCLFPFYCSNQLPRSFYQIGEISQVDVKIISYYSMVKIYSYRFYGKKIE
ncbi:MAG: hypothetical protein O9301_05485 [Leptospira sp.]|nr:hypothetical protein [Leptospira sp.]